MAFDQERLDVYRVAVKFSAWVKEAAEGKELLERIVSMRCRVIGSSDSSTNAEHEHDL